MARAREATSPEPGTNRQIAEDAETRGSGTDEGNVLYILVGQSTKEEGRSTTGALRYVCLAVRSRSYIHRVEAGAGRLYIPCDD
jgi:hypothetical protein